MNYSVYASPNDIVEAIKNPIDWSWIKNNSPKDDSADISRMNKEWDEITFGDSFYGGGTKKVVEKFIGEHSYEAKFSANIEDQFETETFYKKRYKYQNRQTVGSMVDIPRYLNGDQRYWFSIKKIKTENRAIRVYAPMGGIGKVSAKSMRICGALTCAVVEAFEANGVAVELWASCCCRDVLGFTRNSSVEQQRTICEMHNLGEYKAICHLIKIKDSSQYCDLGMINYITGNSGFYRNVIFKDRILMGLKLLSSGLCWVSCGSSCDFSKEYIPEDANYDSAKDIVIPRIYDMDEAKDFLRDTFYAIITE